MTTTTLLERLAEHEKRLDSIIDRDGKPNADDRDYFRREGWIIDSEAWTDRSRPHLQREIARKLTVYRLKERAGTKKQRAELEKLAKKTQAALDKRSGEIHELMAQLQSELTRLENAAAEPQRRLEQATQAVVQLRDHVPVPIREMYADALLAFNVSPTVEEWRETRNEIEALEGTIALEVNREALVPGAEREILKACQSGLRELLTPNGLAVDRQQWHAFIDGKRAELAKLKERFAELDPQVAKMQTELDSILDFNDAE